MKLLKAHSWIFLVFIIAGSFLIVNEAPQYLPQAEIEEESIESKELEIDHSDSSGGQRLKSGGGDGGDKFPQSLADSGLRVPVYSGRTQHLRRPHAQAQALANFPYYILYCNLKLHFC